MSKTNPIWFVVASQSDCVIIVSWIFTYRRILFGYILGSNAHEKNISYQNTVYDFMVRVYLF